MLAEDIYNIDFNNIIICDPIKNSIINQSIFYKLLYSNENSCFNGVFGLFKLNIDDMNRDKIYFNKNKNSEIIKNITILENNILNKLNNSKNKIYKLKELFENNNIKYSNNDINNNLLKSKCFYNYSKKLSIKNDEIHLILKISGLWETKQNLGITFKIILVNNYIQL
jgi:hypothetical protein